MITMTVVAKVNPDKQEEFLQVMRSLRSDRENREGFGTPTLYKEIDDATGFSLICEWETQESLEEYLRAEKFRVLLGAVKVLCKSSEIRYSRTLDNHPTLQLAPMNRGRG
jgi:quinol monooxygenase YgiN